MYVLCIPSEINASGCGAGLFLDIDIFYFWGDHHFFLFFSNSIKNFCQLNLTVLPISNQGIRPCLLILMDVGMDMFNLLHNSAVVMISVVFVGSGSGINAWIRPGRRSSLEGNPFWKKLFPVRTCWGKGKPSAGWPDLQLNQKTGMPCHLFRTRDRSILEVKISSRYLIFCIPYPAYRTWYDFLRLKQDIIWSGILFSWLGLLSWKQPR